MSHAKGNLNVGNDEAFLLQLVSQCQPYIGCSKAWNVQHVINQAAESE